jgi:hypothetical protein
VRSSRARRIAGCFGNTTLVVQWRRVLARGAGPRVRGVGRFFKWLQEDGTMYWSECMETTARSRLLDGLSAPPNAFYVRFLLVYCNARTTTSVDEQDQITTANGGERNLRVCALDPCVRTLQTVYDVTSGEALQGRDRERGIVSFVSTKHLMFYFRTWWRWRPIQSDHVLFDVCPSG